MPRKINFDTGNWFSFIFKNVLYQFPGMNLSMVIMAVLTSSLVLLHDEYGILDFKVPASFHTVLGLVVGLLLVFRTNTAYDRWWDGRKQLGALVNTSRDLALKFYSYASMYGYSGTEEVKYLISAFSWSLKQHLRDQNFSEINDYVPEHLRESFMAASNKPLFILQAITLHGHKMFDAKIIIGEQLAVVENTITVLANIQGACERIRNSPIPMGYALHLKRILLIYLFTLPIGFIHDLEWIAVPTVLIIFYTMIGIELLGEEIEEPFGTDPNDLPFDALNAKIRKDVFEIIERKMPQKDRTVV